jgi:hypothetical protein
MKKLKQNNIRNWLLTALFGSLFVFAGCGEKKGPATSGEIGAPRGDESFGDVVKRRGLNIPLTY